MDKEVLCSPPRPRKRSRSESEDDPVEVDQRVCVIQRKQNREEKCSSSSSDYYCRKGPFLSENSINNILKVVSLQSFSSPRLAQSNEGLNGHQTTRDFGCRSSTDSPPAIRSNGESSHSSEDSASSFRQTYEYPSKITSRKTSSRSKRGERSVNTQKDEKYWEKRVRNNASAKRSRDARRVRELECQIRSEFMDEENRKLELENKMLREENARLLKVIEELESRN